MGRSKAFLSFACASMISFAAGSALAQAPAPEAGSANGLALGVSLDTASGFGAGVLPSYFVGIKMASFYIGGQITYARVGADQPIGGAGTINQHTQTLLLEPEIQLPFLHGVGGRVEGYLQAGIGYGHTWDNCGGNCMGLPGNFLPGGSDAFVLEAAFGARYFFDPSFALGAIAGLQILDSEGPNNLSVTMTGTFEGLTGIAVF